MREPLAKSLAALTAVIVVVLAAAFSFLQNAPRPRDAPSGEPVGVQPPPAARASAGRAVYDRSGCSGCHAIGGEGNPRVPLDGVGERLAPEVIRDWIVASESLRPRLSAAVARIKQSYAALPEEELQALVDYLAGLRTPSVRR